MVSPEQKQRLDLAVVERGLADTRSRARALILAGDILVNGSPAHHAGTTIRAKDELTLKSRPRFVSRGGDKLDHALNSFGIDVTNLVCADLGASTGGFTDVLLQRGAAKVYAIDVGYGQLDEKIRGDERVVVMERLNARYVDALPDPIDVIVIDVSFISLRLILPVAARLLRPEGICVPLIKPQFEAGRREVGKGGVVREPAIHRQVLSDVFTYAERDGFRIKGLVRSPILGPSGNVEFLAHLSRSDDVDGVPTLTLIDEVVPL